MLRYQSTVAFKPSGKVVVEHQSNAARARDVSSLRRGWPSVCEGSNCISPRKSQSMRDQVRKIGDSNLFAAAQVDWLGTFVALHGGDDALGAVAHVQELACRPAGPHTLMARSPGRPGFDALADQGGNHVRAVAGRSCRLGRTGWSAAGRSALKPYCCAIRLGLDQQHLLGQAVRRVGLLGVARPQVILVERHRGELGIGADRADRDELRDARARACSISAAPITRFW